MMLMQHGPPGILAVAMTLGHNPAGLTCKSNNLAAAHEHGPATAKSNTNAGLIGDKQ